MFALHPENVATLLVVGGLITLLLRQVFVWRFDRERRHLPWLLISATGIVYGVVGMGARGRKAQVPFGPALITAAFFCIALAPEILEPFDVFSLT